MPVLFGLPVISILLFIFAGILIGHLIWYYDRSADEDKLRELEDKLAKDNKSSSTHKQELLKLQKCVQQQGSDLEQSRLNNTELQQKYEVARATLAALQKEHQAVLAAKADIDNLNERNTDVARQAGDELARRAKLIDELQSTNKNHVGEIASLKKSLQQQSAASVESADKSRQISELSEQLDLAQQGKQQMQVALDAAHRELEAQSEQQSALRKELAASIQHGESASRRAGQLEKQLKSVEAVASERDQLHQQYESVTDSVTTLQRQLADVSQKVAVAESDNQMLIAEIDKKTELIGQLEQQVRDLSPLQAELQKANQQLEEQKTLSQQNSQIASKQKEEIAQLRLLQGELSTLQSENEELSGQLTEATKVSHSLRQSLAEKAQEVDTLQKGNQEVSQQYSNAESQMQALRAELEKATSSVREMSQENGEIKTQLSQLQAQLEVAANLKTQYAKAAKSRRS